MVSLYFCSVNSLVRQWDPWRALHRRHVSEVHPSDGETSLMPSKHVWIYEWHLCSARNNSRPLAIFWPISTFSWPNAILIGQISCTFSMGTAFSNLKISIFRKTADQFLILISSTVVGLIASPNSPNGGFNQLPASNPSPPRAPLHSHLPTPIMCHQWYYSDFEKRCSKSSSVN